MESEDSKQPAEHANGASPISGVVPPEHARWKPGQSGNPNGRPRSAGMTIREWINALAAEEKTEDEIRQIARSKSAPWPKRAAAERILRTLEAGDLADFEPLLNGKAQLADLRTSGVNTEVVKKIKQKSRIVPAGDDTFEEVVEREIELHDRGGVDFDRIMDRTEGRVGPASEPEEAAEQITIRIRPIVTKSDDFGTG